MSAIRDRCHGCGTKRRSADQRFCPKCGRELPAFEAPAAVPAGHMAWSYLIPVVNNRYTWIRWGLAALAFGGGFALVLGTLIVVMFPDGFGFAMKVYLAIGILSGAVVIGLGLFGAMGVGNDVGMRFVLTPERAIATMSDRDEASLNLAASVISPNSASSAQNAQVAALLLPSDNEAKWKDVRRVQFDEGRSVITLRRRWHHPLRLYVPRERFAEASAFVRERTRKSGRSDVDGTPRGAKTQA